MEKSLKEKKIEMKDVWESCFELKLEDKLTEKGLKKFWDENTSIEEAEEMLTRAAIYDLVDSLFDSLADKIIIGVGGCNDKDERGEKCCNVKHEESFKVIRIKDHIVFKDVFETRDEAYEFIKEMAMNSRYSVNDFVVCKGI